MDPIDQEITDRICSSKKYRDIYRPTVERIVSSLPHPKGARKESPKEREEAARNMLHQVWGAYWETRPDFTKLLGRIQPQLAAEDAATRQAALRTLMRLHSSTRERLEILPEFFKRIWESLGDGVPPASVIDHGCGFMPLAYPWMGLPGAASYSGYDIDRGQNGFTKAVLAAAHVPAGTEVRDGDVLVDAYPYADVVFMLKLVPLLVQQVGESATQEVLARQACRWLVVSYPVASLGGRDKGMAAFYRNQFKAMMEKCGRTFTELAFPDELVFITSGRKQ